MNPLFLSRSGQTRPRLFSLAVLAALIFSLGIVRGYAQQAQLSLADILIGLRSKKVTLTERNQLLAGAVKERGITFTLTPEIETELISGGASDELIAAIQLKSPKLKIVAQATPAPTPIPAPVIVAAPTPPPVAVVVAATPTPAPTPDFAFYRNRADENNFKGEFDRALTDYNKAIELNPQDNVSYLNRGRAFSGKQNYDSAIADFSRAIEINPQEPLAYFNRADSFEKKGDVAQAINDYLKASELDATNETAKNNLKRLQDAQAKLVQQPAVVKTPPVAPEIKKQETPVNPADAATAPQSVELGQLNSLAVRMVMPVYPEIAKKLGASGRVNVQITLDETGKVVNAKATGGNSLLRGAAEEAARRTKFKPAAAANGQAVKATGYIVYNFVDAP